MQNSKIAIIEAYHDLGLKWCIHCKEFLSEKEFYIANHQKYGLKPTCKKCNKIENAIYNQDTDAILKRRIRVAKQRKLKKNKKKNKRWAKAYRNKIKDDPFVKLNNSMSRGIYRGLKSNKNGHHWELLVDYTLSDLKKYLKKRFTKGMNWNNQGNGKDKWNIDHIIPTSKFNFTKPEHTDFKKCWSLKNLRPMWSSNNMSKGNKIDKPFQPSLQI